MGDVSLDLLVELQRHCTVTGCASGTQRRCYQDSFRDFFVRYAGRLRAFDVFVSSSPKQRPEDEVAVDSADCRKASASARAFATFPDSNQTLLKPNCAVIRQNQCRKNLGVRCGSHTLLQIIVFCWRGRGRNGTAGMLRWIGTLKKNIEFCSC